MKRCHCDDIDDQKVIDHLNEHGPAADEKAMKKIRGDLHRKHARTSYPGGNRCGTCPGNLGDCIMRHSRKMLEAAI